MTDISLQNFSSIFEILLTYYIGTAASEKFNGIFGVEENFIRLLNENYLFSVESTELRRLQRRIDPNVQPDTADGREQRVRDVNLYARLLTVVNKKEKIEEFKIRVFDGYLLWHCLRPYYVFAGLFALWLLILGGLVENWARHDAIMYLNWIASFVFITAVFRVLFRVSSKIKHWGPVRSFGFSSFGFILIILPNTMLCKLPHFVPWQWLTSLFDNLSYNDFQIVISIFLVFSILLLHITYIVVFALKVARLSNQMRKVYVGILAANSVSLADRVANIGDDIQSLNSPR